MRRFFGVVVMVVGCGGRAPQAEAPVSAGPSGAKADDDAGERADAADGEFEAQPSAPSPAPPPPTVSTTGDVLATPEEALAALRASEGELEAVALSTEGGACPRACRALASMRRASDRLCELTAEDDARCRDARTRVANGARRAEDKGCGCP
ncbi:MAG: hypothetical protein AAGA56_13785 [Myxococcota bacterium]